MCCTSIFTRYLEKGCESIGLECRKSIFTRDKNYLVKYPNIILVKSTKYRFVTPGCLPDTENYLVTYYLVKYPNRSLVHSTTHQNVAPLCLPDTSHAHKYPIPYVPGTPINMALQSIEFVAREAQKILVTLVHSLLVINPN